MNYPIIDTLPWKSFYNMRVASLKAQHGETIGQVFEHTHPDG